jgi:hypothetical protein
MTDEEVQERMKKLMDPVDSAIMNCESAEDMLMLASVMITTATGIFESVLGKEASQGLIKELLNK